MRTKQLFAAALTIAWVLPVCGADRPDVRNTREKFRSIRPTAADLALYQLDWAPTLKAAREKAAVEQRPILLVLVTNSFGDLCSGHC